ncbi:Ig-like domain-containing protein [bacterium]|nr:Ig-like domain-containing protein [bacterium]
MKYIQALTIGCVIAASPLAGQVTGLAGWNIFLDPGHSHKENQGAFGYSEAERNVRVALNLRDLLLERTDIDTVYISRTDDVQTVSLSQRTDYANSVGAAWFHSIHSDASSNPNTNSTLLLWGQYRDGTEKVPNGGRAMSSVIVDILSRGMRIPTTGSRGDYYFYYSTPQSGFNGPYLHVNRNSTMPSELSEAGFHTNPGQNQLFMNDDWKKFEAMTYYWSVLQLFGIDRPFVGICSGIISDLDTGIPVNGATVTLDGQTYTTDTYQSLFYRFTSDPEKLHNGFYFLEDLSPGIHEMIVGAEGYYADTSYVTVVDTFFTFRDIQLLSQVPPAVTETVPAQGDTNFPAWETISITFSRCMNTASVEDAFSIVPEASGTFSWSADGTQLFFGNDDLDFETEYILTVSAAAEDVHGHSLDGNGDGMNGDAFVLSFKTGPSDMSPPVAIDIYPLDGSDNNYQQPIITVVFNEEVDPSSFFDDMLTLHRNPRLPKIPGTLDEYVVNEQSVFCFFPDSPLLRDTGYHIRLHPGLTDLFGNTSTSFQTADFIIGSDTCDVRMIDDFENSLADNWWGPLQSGTTTGVIPQQTTREENTRYVNHLFSSQTALQLNYGWDVSAGSWIIRTYLAGGPPHSVIFTKEYSLQVYLFGDGSGNRFRFCVDDNYPVSAAANHEVSPWYTIDWIGWRLISWDMKTVPAGTWIGDGDPEGNLRFDSIQLTYTQGCESAGVLYFDDLRAVKTVETTSVLYNESVRGLSAILYDNYPNPFNPETTIRYFLAEPAASVHLEIYNILGERIRAWTSGHSDAGTYSVLWDGRDASGNQVASGTYIYLLRAGDVVKSKRMLVIR